MNIIFSGGIVFIAGLLTQLILWKIRLPRNQTRALLVIFFSLFALSFLFLRYDIFQQLRYLIFTAALVFAYVTTYSAVEVDSPSLLLVLKVAQRGRAGMKRDDVMKTFSDETVLLPRLEDLIAGGMAARSGEKIMLTPRGRLLCDIFIFFRRLLGAPKGG